MTHLLNSDPEVEFHKPIANIFLPPQNSSLNVLVSTWLVLLWQELILSELRTSHLHRMICLVEVRIGLRTIFCKLRLYQRYTSASMKNLLLSFCSRVSQFVIRACA